MKAAKLLPFSYIIHKINGHKPEANDYLLDLLIWAMAIGFLITYILDHVNVSI